MTLKTRSGWAVLCGVALAAVAGDARAEAPALYGQASALVDALVLVKLADMHILRTATLPESPWSDDYWALYVGSIAKRYADPAYPQTTDWKVNSDHIRTTTPANPDHLSPAEKYDLLVGDAKRTLTEYNLNQGQPYYESDGKVETWMGIEHGWAAASYMIPRPTKAIAVTAANGVTKIKFFPSDIKALATALWANTNPKVRLVGGRCDVKDPDVDVIGRIKDLACRDVNPATWHLAVVNQIGKAKRSLVLDTTYDYEVWNQPVYSYSYTYFNPKTLLTSTSLLAAKVAVGVFPEDKFKAYRAAGTTHIVGIAMDVKWTVETSPSHYSPDSASRDSISGARYLYTLELSSDGAIIGGEWQQKAHPDFLWTPPPGAKATAPYESEATNTWDGQSAMPLSWRNAAAKASVTGAPLGIIVDRLVTLSRQ